MTRPARRRVFSLLAALTMSVSAPLPLLLIGTLAVQLRDDVGLQDGHIGVASTIFFLGSSMLSIAAGSLTDRLGWQSAARIGSTASTLALLLVAALAKGLWTFLPLFVIGSIGHTFAGPAGNVAIASEMPTHRLALLFGMKQTANPIANLFAGASVPLVGLTIGWRWAFVLAATFPIVAIASTFLANGGATAPIEPVVAATPAPGEGSRRVDVRMAPVLALAASGGFASFGASALGAYIVLSAVEAGVEEGSAGLYVVLAAVVGLVVRVASGWWADRTGSAGLRPMVAMLVVGTAAYVALAIGRESVVLPATVLAYAAGWGWPGLYQFSIAHHYRAATGRITGRVMTGMLLGGVAGPLVFSVLQHRYGYGAAWMAVAAATLMGAAATVWAAHELRGGAAAVVRQAAAVAA